MNWFEFSIANDASVATKKGQNLRAVDRVRDLDMWLVFLASLQGRMLTFLILITPLVSSLAFRQYSTNGKFCVLRASKRVGLRVQPAVKANNSMLGPDFLAIVPLGVNGLSEA